jgi:hypothetical protein
MLGQEHSLSKHCRIQQIISSMMPWWKQQQDAAAAVFLKQIALHYITLHQPGVVNPIQEPTRGSLGGETSKIYHCHQRNQKNKQRETHQQHQSPEQ